MSCVALASRAARGGRFAAALLTSALFACDDASEPKDPVWNKQPCDHCHMVVSDPRYAAQLSTRDGQRLYFDDIGCLAERINAANAEVAHAWVREGNAWRDAYLAHFAQGEKTPMDYGFVPSASGTLAFAEVLRAVADKRSTRHP